MNAESLPIAVIGAGPVGLAAAAHLVSRGETPIVLEAGLRGGGHRPSMGACPRVLALALQHRCGCGRHAGEGGVDHAGPRASADGPGARRGVSWSRSPRSRRSGRTCASVPGCIGVSRRGFDKLRTQGRETAPFVVRVLTPAGEGGDPRPGGDRRLRHVRVAEPPRGRRDRAHGEKLASRIGCSTESPTCWVTQRHRYAGRRVAVVGSGHSALNTLIELAELCRSQPGTRDHLDRAAPAAGAGLRRRASRTPCRRAARWDSRRGSSSTAAR